MLIMFNSFAIPIQANFLLFLLLLVTIGGEVLVVDSNDTKNSINSINSSSSNNKNNNSRRTIVGGHPVEWGVHPSFGRSGGNSLCGGTLIHPDMFLTASHCVNIFKQNGVYIGGIHRDGSDSEWYQVDYEIPYPTTRSSSTNDDETIVDLMIVKLTTPSTAPIQKLNFDDCIPEDNSIVTAVGYGVTEFGGTYPDVLMEVQLQSFQDKLCKQSYPNQYDPNTMLCAASFEGGKDTCNGDSGGPLLTVDGIQVGITLYGLGCANNGFPGIYTKIGAFEKFIKDTICGYSNVLPTSANTTSTTSTTTTTITSSIECNGRPRLSPPCTCQRNQYLCRILRRCVWNYPSS